MENGINSHLKQGVREREQLEETWIMNRIMKKRLVSWSSDLNGDEWTMVPEWWGWGGLYRLYFASLFTPLWHFDFSPKKYKILRGKKYIHVHQAKSRVSAAHTVIEASTGTFTACTPSSLPACLIKKLCSSPGVRMAETAAKPSRTVPQAFSKSVW